MLNPQSPIPLYHQLADILMTQIREGEFPVGSRIPSEIQLAKQYGIGRPTARQATELLIRRHMLTRRRGSGTYVLSDQREIDLFSFDGTIASFSKKGVSLTTRLVENIHLKTIGEDRENPFSNQRAYVFSRLSFADNIPVLIEDFYLHRILFNGIDKIDLANRSLSHIVHEHYYMVPERGKQNFRIDYLSGKQAKLLEISSDTPILKVQRFLHFPLADNGLYSELFCRTDRFVFSQTIGDITDG